MSEVKKLFGITFSSRRIDEVDYTVVEIYTSSGAPSILEKKEFRFANVDAALLALVHEYSKTKVVVRILLLKEITFTQSFIKDLSNLLQWDPGFSSLDILNCEVDLSQAQFEDWICSLKLKQFTYLTNVRGAVEINDKIISSVKEFHAYSDIGIAAALITDLFLNHWKEKVPPPKCTIQNIQTSFTLKAVTDMIKFSLRNEWVNYFKFGNIECRTEDGKYLIELQQLPQVNVTINEEYQIYSKRSVGQPQFVFKPMFNE